MTIRKLIVLILAALVICDAAAEPVALNPNHPQRHVVTEGDTLWDISARFLRDPWLWPEVWHANPQISNPHLIYPGDTISLIYVDGKPQLRLNRGGISSAHTDLPVVKLSPGIRAEKLDRTVPTIPRDAVQQFLTVPLVVGKKELARLPYIVASAGEHLVTGAGDRIYVRSITEQEAKKFNVFRPGGAFRDPDSREILGYEAVYVGDATVQSYGDPATLLLTRTTMEAGIGDRLKPVEIRDNPLNFFPHAPEQPVEGRIISVVGGVSQIGSYQVVVLNRGTREGMEIGHVLTIYQTGRTIVDQVKKKINAKVKLPDEEAGLLMVFRTFDKVSYALVMEAARPIHVLDLVRNPT